MKIQIGIAGILMAGAITLLTGCAAERVSETFEEESNSTSTLAEPNQEKPVEPNYGTFDVSESKILGYPAKIGEYELIAQPMASEAGICIGTAPFKNAENGFQELQYLNPEALASLGKDPLRYCNTIYPDQSEPYDEQIYGLVRIFIDFDLSDHEKASANCEYFSDALYAGCFRHKEGTRTSYGAFGNFEDPNQSEAVLTAMLDAIEKSDPFELYSRPIS